MKLLRTPCDACPWTGRLELAKGRLKSLAEDCKRRDAHFVCHKFLRPGDTEEDGDGHAVAGPDVPVCRGFCDALPGVGQLVRIMGRVGGLEEIDPP